MTHTLLCPDQRQLEVFFRAELSVSDMEAFGEHITVCPTCRETVEGWHSTLFDPLFRDAATLPVSDEEIRDSEPVIERIASRLKEPFTLPSKRRTPHGIASATGSN